MLCLCPIDLNRVLRPCGQCMNCRINKQRTWSCRIQLEAKFYTSDQCIFLTLTYDEDNVPLNENGDSILLKRDLADFIKALRQEYSYQHSKFRMFGVGEYGETTQRAHYHAILFGVGLDAEPLIAKTWGRGFHQLGEFNSERASYVAQYTLKKMTQDGARGLYGRTPEFSSMSQGLGRDAVPWLAAQARTKNGLVTIQEAGDVWTSIRIDGKVWPLGQYLRRKLRNALGLSQNERERLIQLDWYDSSTGEILQPEPLPADFSPWADFGEAPTPWRQHVEKKARKQEIPDLEAKAAHRQRRKARRIQTVHV